MRKKRKKRKKDEEATFVDGELYHYGYHIIGGNCVWSKRNTLDS